MPGQQWSRVLEPPAGPWASLTVEQNVQTPEGSLVQSMKFKDAQGRDARITAMFSQNAANQNTPTAALRFEVYETVALKKARILASFMGSPFQVIEPNWPTDTVERWVEFLNISGRGQIVYKAEFFDA